MPYNNSISSTDMAGLIPTETSDEILQRTTEQSAVLRLGRRLRDMPTSTKTMPVVSSLPTAYFTSGETGLRQTSEVNWANVTLTAEELNVIVPVPKSAFADSGYPIWDQIKPLLAEAAGKAVDQAVIHGTNIPASWTTAFGAHAGIVALATAHSATVSLAACDDVYDALLGESGVISALEADGFLPSGYVAHVSMRGKLRGCRDSEGQPIFRTGANVGMQFATGELDGAPILYPLNGALDSSAALLLAGQWNQLVYAMRSDIEWMVSDQATIQDATGAIVYNLFQQRMIALLMTMRLGFALPNTITRLQETEGSRSPFAVLTA